MELLREKTDRQRRRHHPLRDGGAGRGPAGAQARARLRHLVRAAAANHDAEDQASRGRADGARAPAQRVHRTPRCAIDPADRAWMSEPHTGGGDRRAAAAAEAGSAALSGCEPRARPRLRFDGARRAADRARAAASDEGAAEGRVGDLHRAAAGGGADGRRRPSDDVVVRAQQSAAIVGDDSSRPAAGHRSRAERTARAAVRSQRRCCFSGPTAAAADRARRPVGRREPSRKAAPTSSARTIRATWIRC